MPDPVGIITALMHPPYGGLTRETYGPLTAGLTRVQRVRGPVTLDVFAIGFSFFTIPAQFGWTQQLVKEYELPIVTYAPLYTILSGQDVYGEKVTLHREGDILYFDQLLPKAVDIWVQTGCTVILHFYLSL